MKLGSQPTNVNKLAWHLFCLQKKMELEVSSESTELDSTLLSHLSSYHLLAGYVNIHIFTFFFIPSDHYMQSCTSFSVENLNITLLYYSIIVCFLKKNILNEKSSCIQTYIIMPVKQTCKFTFVNEMLQKIVSCNQC